MRGFHAVGVLTGDFFEHALDSTHFDCPTCSWASDPSNSPSSHNGYWPPPCRSSGLGNGSDVLPSNLSGVPNMVYGDSRWERASKLALVLKTRRKGAISNRRGSSQRLQRAASNLYC